MTPAAATDPSAIGAIETGAPSAPLKRQLPTWFFLVVVVLGVALRLWMATLGHNWDLASYQTVAQIVDAGGNVYAETERYNYGPLWLAKHIIAATTCPVDSVMAMKQPVARGQL